MHWHLSNRADPRAVALADRHYNRQKIGTPQFVPPGRCLVLLTEDATALWVTSWPFAAYVKHAWAGAWVCSLFRNESETLSSELIRSAVAATRWYYGDAPTLGFITFVDASKTRRKRDPGRCYRKAGWTHVGYTIGGLHALQRYSVSGGRRVVWCRCRHCDAMRRTRQDREFNPSEPQWHTYFVAQP